jgi:hypothetical protein
MSKIQTTANNRKSTDAGYNICADLGSGNLPHLAEALSTAQEAKDLNLFVGIVKKARRLQMLDNYLAARVINPHTFAEMQTPVLPCRTEGVAARCLDAVHPVGTMEWTYEVFPELRAHVCEFLLAADEMEDMVRDLTAGYNYVGVDPEDLNDILTKSNHLCKKLALFSKVNEKRLRVMAKLGRTNTTRKMNPDGDKQAA